jgi:hypothetical protein
MNMALSFLSSYNDSGVYQRLHHYEASSIDPKVLIVPQKIVPQIPFLGQPAEARATNYCNASAIAFHSQERLNRQLYFGSFF